MKRSGLRFPALLAGVLVPVGLLACSKQSDPPDLVKTQREALQKAKQVDQTVQKAAAEMQRKIDEAERK